MIRDDDACRLRQELATDDSHAKAGEMKKELCGVVRDRATAVDPQPWYERDQNQRECTDEQEDEDGVDAINRIPESL